MVLVAGFDLGSRSVKIAFREGESYTFSSYDTVEFYRRYGRLKEGRLLVDLRALGLPEGVKIVSTGYGRNTVKIHGGKDIPEIKAHVLGAIAQTGLSDFTLLDLGGQDTKVALVRGGRLVDFQTNDRCAAGSGRYLENMAAVLGMKVEELGEYLEEPVELDATCAIFGESELVGRIIEGHPPARLAAGVNYTIWKRVRPMLENLLSDVVVFTGGVAYNRAVVEIIRRETGVQVVVPAEPRYNGAIGCCVYALQTEGERR